MDTADRAIEPDRKSDYTYSHLFKNMHWKKEIVNRSINNCEAGEDIPECANNYISTVLKHYSNLYEGECKECFDKVVKDYIETSPTHIPLTQPNILNILKFYKKYSMCKHKKFTIRKWWIIRRKPQKQQ